MRGGAKWYHVLPKLLLSPCTPLNKVSGDVCPFTEVLCLLLLPVPLLPGNSILSNIWHSFIQSPATHEQGQVVNHMVYTFTKFEYVRSVSRLPIQVKRWGSKWGPGCVCMAVLILGSEALYLEMVAVVLLGPLSTSSSPPPLLLLTPLPILPN